MKTFQLKVALHGISPMVWRRLELPDTASLAQLHFILQAAFQWDNDYLHQFHIHGKNYGIAYAGGISFSNNPHQVILADFEFDEGDKCRYEYNFFDYWVVDIRIEKIIETNNLCQLRCIKGNGMPGVTKHDVITAEFNLLEAIANSDTTTRIVDILLEIEAYQSVLFGVSSWNV